MKLKLVTFNSDNGLLLSFFPTNIRRKKIIESFKLKLIRQYKDAGYDEDDAATEFASLENNIEITVIKQGVIIRNEDAHF